MKVTSADWIKQGSLHGIDLEDIMFQDKKGMYSRLDDLGLPRQEVLIYTDDSYLQELDEIKEFIERGEIVFCRLQPRSLNLPKYYKTDIEKLDDLLDFLGENEVCMDDYELHLVHNGVMQYSGIIISSDSTVGELVRGHCIKIQYGLEDTPLHAEVDISGKFSITEDDSYSDDEKDILLKAMRMIGAPRKTLPGYYEFIVVNDRIIFKNYQKKGGFSRI